MEQPELIPHLFRTEYRKIASVLCKRFGIDHLGMAEDIASDTFLLAAETWGIRGLPENPVAWLYTVARNKTLDRLRHDAVFRQKIAKRFGGPDGFDEDFDIDLSEQNISDSQLQMLFAICNEAIPREAQVGLALRILCGFGIGEIAEAFLTNRETINKRLYRARETLRREKTPVSFPPPNEVDKRLKTVLTTLYLLFNEGCYSNSGDRQLRQELCHEAMRLTHLLIANPATDQPEVNALLALMSFHASRFGARVAADGAIILYRDQDTSLWNPELVRQGEYFLSRSAAGQHLSRYHLEAAIAWWHTVREDTAEKWQQILQLYNQLLFIEYSPVAALNRTYSLAMANGKEEAIREAEKLGLDGNHLYHALLAELYSGIDKAKMAGHLQLSLASARSDSERKLVLRKMKDAGLQDQ